MGLKEVFTLFQIQYNRSYSNPAGIMGHLSPAQLFSHLREEEIKAQGPH